MLLNHFIFGQTCLEVFFSLKRAERTRIFMIFMILSAFRVEVKLDRSGILRTTSFLVVPHEKELGTTMNEVVLGRPDVDENRRD